MQNFDLRDNIFQHFRSDFSAALTVAVMLVPQSMAYAMLASLPPVYGLYAATLPLIIYAIFGSSRQLAVGPVAIVSLMVADACSGLSSSGAEIGTIIAAATLIALLAGLIQILLGIFKAGFLLNFVSHAVVSGFTSAAAIMIALSQVPGILRIEVASSNSAITLIISILKELKNTHFLSLIFAALAALVLYIGKKRAWKFPVILPLTIVAILVTWFFKLEDYGLKCVGEVPGGFPAFKFNKFSLNDITSFLPATLGIVFIGVMESVAIGKLIATREKYRINPDRELIALGLANVGAAFFSGYPVTGGFSRTAVNYQAGAKSSAAGIYTAALILLTLFFLTPVFKFMPTALLAAVIVVAVSSLIDFEEAKKLFTIKAADGWIFTVSFVITLFFGIDKGLLAGIIFSLALFILRSAKPEMALLGKVNKNEFRDLRRFPNAEIAEDKIILRIDASLYFANAAFVENRLRSEVANREGLKWIILEVSGVNDIDAVAVNMLSELMEDCEAIGVNFVFSGMKAKVRDIVTAAGWKEKYAERICPANLENALLMVRE